jgi:hypothetical protein
MIIEDKIMAEESEVLETPPDLIKRVLFTPHQIVLIIMWFLTTVPTIIMLFRGVRSSGQLRDQFHILQAAYVLALFWYLIRTGPSVEQLPELNPLVLPKRRIGKWIPVIMIALLFWSEFAGQGILLPLLMLASIWILIVWRREIGFVPTLLGLAVATIALLGGLPMYRNYMLGKEIYFVLLVFVPPMFVAGGLLYQYTGLGGSQLFKGQYSKALRSFLSGCLLFVPFGLLNAATQSPGTSMTWVNHWWMPFSLPFFSGLAEEVWFRLFLVTLCYFMLRPAFNQSPAVAVILSVLFSGIVFGLGHGGLLIDRFLITGLLFGVPLGVIYVRRDWEHAVAAHYMINMIPWIMVYFET